MNFLELVSEWSAPALPLEVPASVSTGDAQRGVLTIEQGFGFKG